MRFHCARHNTCLIAVWMLLGSLATCLAATPTLRKVTVGGESIALVRIQGGAFMMGTPVAEASREPDESPQHRIQLKPFWLATTEVTQALWVAVMTDNPSRFAGCGLQCPVDSVSWEDAQIFIHTLNARTGQRWRLPTEAEWEFAARAGCTKAFQVGHACRNVLPLRAAVWNSDRPQPVASRPANRWGLHDMQGNVWEWVQDCWDHYDQADDSGRAVEFTPCKGRVLRGGSWFNDARWLRAGARNYFEPTFRYETIGLRLAQDDKQP